MFCLKLVQQRLNDSWPASFLPIDYRQESTIYLSLIKLCPFGFCHHHSREGRSFLDFPLFVPVENLLGRFIIFGVSKAVSSLVWCNRLRLLPDAWCVGSVGIVSWRSVLFVGSAWPLPHVWCIQRVGIDIARYGTLLLAPPMGPSPSTGCISKSHILNWWSVFIVWS